MATDAFHTALESNKHWADDLCKQKPDLFPKLAKGQAPEILWIGCSDSRVPETTLLGKQPGEVFVHRNIANVLHASDTSSLAVIEYAVKHLKVKHVVLCGHTACGGVAAALGQGSVGSVLDGWLMPVRRLRKTYAKELEGLSKEEKNSFLIKQNVRQGVQSLREMAVITHAIKDRGLTVHGCVYDVGSGHLDVVDGCDEEEHHKQHREGIFHVE